MSGVRGLFLIVQVSLMVCVFTVATHAQSQVGTVQITVRSTAGKPIPQVELRADNTIIAVTNDQGVATLERMAGELEVTLQRVGYKAATTKIAVATAQTTQVVVELEAQAVLEESIVVTATRSESAIEDEPLRVEVVDQSEVEEKATMTPGDIAMLLNETGGLRVQVVSPALGAANVRVQGLRGRYTQILSDGLPLYGQVGSIGILQIPPLDLRQVEVIKGVASALYGSSALGGVINLVSRRPGKESERQVLLNTTSRGGADAVVWVAEPPKNQWSYSVLGGAHFQRRSDIDEDSWADLAEYQRGVLRPRLFWENGSGNSIVLTTGITAEDRAGGSPAFPEELRTRRVDSGFIGRFVAGRKLISVRGSAMTQGHRRQFGTVVERDRQNSFFGEAAVSGVTAAHSWTLGTAIQVDNYHSEELSRFDYLYSTPAVFAQDEYRLGSKLTVSASGRLDVHNKYGTFFSPRVSALVRLPQDLTLRVSTGTGVFAPTPLTEEAEATGLTQYQAPQNLEAERAWSSSADLGWRRGGIELNATFFGSRIRNVVDITQNLAFANAPEPTRTIGTEFFARARRGEFSVILTHAFVHSTEFDVRDGVRRVVPLTPRHTAGIDLLWEKEDVGRIGLEAFYTGGQQLDDNPYRTSGIPYWVFGILLERHVGPVRVFLNAENLGDFRQTRYDSLVRPIPSFDGRRTVGAWSPLEGRVINGGIRFGF